MKEIQNAQIIGGGPAGLSLIVSADHNGHLDQLLSSGAAFIERSGSLGSGSLNGVKSSSNSQANEFLGAVGSLGIFCDVFQQQPAQAIEGFGENILPLPYVSEFLNSVGKIAQNAAEDHPGSTFLGNREVASVVVANDGESNVFTSLDRFGEVIARSRQIVLAPGAEERAIDLGTPERNKKLFTSHEVLSDLYHDEITGRLLAREGTIIILGGSHSALAVADLSLAQYADEVEFGEGNITVFHRSPIKIFYNTRAEAETDGYSYTEADTCPITGRVNRFQGGRGPASNLYRRVTQGDEDRVHLVRTPRDLTSIEELDEAAIVVQALGYNARSIPLIDTQGRTVGPLVVNGRVDVDQQARIYDANGHVVQGAYAMGLGHGFKPNPEIGGEPSAANHPVDAINFYAGPVGEIIYKQLLKKGGEK